MLLTLNVVARQMRDKKRALELKNKPQCKLTDVKITRKFDEKQSVIKEEKKRASIQEARKKQFDLKMKDRRHALEHNHKRNTGENRDDFCLQTLINATAVLAKDDTDYDSMEPDAKRDRIFEKMVEFESRHHLRSRDLFEKIDQDKSGPPPLHPLTAAATNRLLALRDGSV